MQWKKLGDSKLGLGGFKPHKASLFRDSAGLLG